MVPRSLLLFFRLQNVLHGLSPDTLGANEVKGVFPVLYDEVAANDFPGAADVDVGGGGG